MAALCSVIKTVNNSLSLRLTSQLMSHSVNRLHVKYSRCGSTVVSPSKVKKSPKKSEKKKSDSLSIEDHLSTTGQDWSDHVGTSVKDNIRDSFNIRNLSDSVFKLYHVRVNSMKDNGGSALVFPWSENIRSLSTSNTHQLNNFDSNNLGIFGWNTINNNNNSKQLIITDNELDAMAAHQVTDGPSIAVNLKEDMSTSLYSPKILKELEQMDKIYIWCDTKEMTWITKLTKLLKNSSCFVISSKDGAFDGPLDALNKNLSFSTILTNAQPVSHKKILNFSQLRDDVYLEFVNSEKVAGVKWVRYSYLSKIMKGLRPGELTILTGPTGCGKTTLMSELSLDLCQQGVSTLWGSFEISNVRLIKTMLRQLSGLNLDLHLSKYQPWADKFQTLPFKFMGFHGQADISHVINAMHHSVMFNGVQHIIIDNLQFMVGMKSRSFDDSFHAQNAAIAEFRHFATANNVHVTIIVHPRKEGEDKLLSTSSISGTAKAGQEADNVLILQVQPNKEKFLQVTKNRFSGDLGSIPLKFDRNSLTFSGVFQSPVVQNEVKKTTTKTTSQNKIVPQSKITPQNKTPTQSIIHPLKPVIIETPTTSVKSSPSFLKPLIPNNSRTFPA